MAITAALAVAAVGAGTGIYSAVQAGNAQEASNRYSAAAFGENRRQNTQNATIDTLNTLRNGYQQAIDNQRYDEAKIIEDAQRKFTNQLATATQYDADGNALHYDPVTGTWTVSNRGVGAANADARRTQTSLSRTQALEGAIVGGQQARDRMVQGGIEQSGERALGQALMARYANNQGRSPEALQGALMERNVAEITDPLQTGGNMAMLAGYRQGNSGNDALMGALARQSQGGTRTAIANARLDAPAQSLNERDMAAKSILGPASTLTARGFAPMGQMPTFGGDASTNMLASIGKTNPAGVGSSLNPRGSQTPVNLRSGNLTGFTPLNASGNAWAGIGQGAKSILENDEVKQLLKNWGTARNTTGAIGGGAEL